MAVAYVDSTSTGASDSFVSTVNVPVPTGTAANHVAVLALEQWESANPTVTWPSGFIQVTQVVSGSQKLKAAWKRLTGADAGNYTASWTGSQWTVGHCVLMSGCKTTGDPIGANFNPATATGTAIPATSLTVGFVPGLLHFVANENSALQTTPPSIGVAMTEVEDSNYLHSNYLIPAASGTFTTSGGVLAASTLQLALLLALEPDGGAAVTSDPVRREKQTRLGALLQM